jgi:hypothetical protein
MQLTQFIILLAPFLALAAPNKHPDNHRRHDQDDKNKECKNHHDRQCIPDYRPKPIHCPKPIFAPSAPYTITAYAPGHLIHNRRLNAGQQSFHLGGATLSYCPEHVKGPSCPPGNETVILYTTGSISTILPQKQWIDPSGRIGYTQGNATVTPLGSLPFSFGYRKCPDELHGHITTNIWGADGFMACPEFPGGLQAPPTWALYAAMSNATVPSYHVKDCIKFDGLTTDYIGPLPAAWEYT